MPIHEFGYRAWQGATRARWARAWSITRTGVTLARRPLFVRRLCFLAIVPLLYLGWIFFGIGVLTDPDQGRVRGPLGGVLRGILTSEQMTQLRDDPGALRAEIWNDMFLAMHTWTLPAIALILLSVAPKLISNDLRTKAFLLYFSKPIGQAHYVVGKAGILAAFLAWFTLVPSLGTYVLSILFAPSIDTLFQTWTVLPSIVLASLLVIVPLTAIGLFVSSTNRDQRVATFALIAVILGGEVVFATLSNLDAFRSAAWPELFSLRETTTRAIQGVFDAPSILQLGYDGRDSSLAIWFLCGVSVLCTLGLWRRVSAPMNV